MVMYCGPSSFTWGPLVLATVPGTGAHNFGPRHWGPARRLFIIPPHCLVEVVVDTSPSSGNRKKRRKVPAVLLSLANPVRPSLYNTFSWGPRMALSYELAMIRFPRCARDWICRRQVIEVSGYWKNARGLPGSVSRHRPRLQEFMRDHRQSRPISTGLAGS